MEFIYELEDGTEYRYEPDYADLNYEAVWLLYKEFYQDKSLSKEQRDNLFKKVKKMVFELDLEERLVEYFEEDLKEIYQEKAYEVNFRE